MKVKEIIKLLKECDQEKEVLFNSYGDHVDINLFKEYSDVILIEE